MKKILLAIILMLSLGIVASCNSVQIPTISIDDSIEVEQGSVIDINELNVDIENAVNVSIQEIIDSFSFTSSNPDVVSVNGKELKAVGVGSAKITIKCSLFESIELTLKVKVVAPKTTELSKDDILYTSELKVGDSFTLAVNNLTEGETVTVTSSDVSILKVEDRKVTALKKGDATLNVKVTEGETIKLNETVSIKVNAVVKNITYVLNGGENPENAPLTFDIGEETTLPTPTRSGFKFAGWYLSADFTGSVITKIASTQKEDVTLYAKFVKVYSIMYALDGGTLDPNAVSEYLEGSKVTLPTPTKEGYTFVCWKDANGAVVNEITADTKGDLVLTANYKAISHTITYELDGGTSTGDTSFTEVQEYVLPTATKDGYNFLGWSLTKGGATYITKIEKGTKSDVTLYANFEKIVEDDGIKITYVYEDGSLPTHTAASLEEFAETFWNELYTWSGSSLSLDDFKSKALAAWKVGNEYSSAKVYKSSSKNTIVSGYFVNEKGNTLWMDWMNVFDSMVTDINSSQTAWGSTYVGYLRLYSFLNQSSSIWTKTRTQKVYEAYPISTPLVKEVTPGESVDLVNLTIDDGREFLGWYDNAGNKITSTSQITKSITLTAKWSASTPVTSFTVTNKISKILRLDSYALEYNIAPSNATNKKVKFTSSDSTILSIDEDGVMTSHKDGTVTITVKCLDNSALDVSFNVTVYIDPFIDLAPTTTILEPNASIEIPATVYEAKNKTVLWKSSDQSIVSVDKTGQITAVKEGYATITAYLDGAEDVKAEVGITVLAANDPYFQYIESAHNSSIHVTRDLYVGYAYYTDVFVSASDLLFNYDYNVNTDFESVQAANSSNHGGALDTVEFITVHYTAGTSKSSTAKATATYMCNSNSVSIHYTTGNDGIYHCLSNTLIGYHAGDGTGTKFEWINTGVKATANVKPNWGVVASTTSSTGWFFTLNGQATTIAVPVSGTSSSGKAMTISNPANNFTYFGPAWKVVNGVYYMGSTWACFTQTLAGAISSRGGNRNSIGIETACNEGSDLWYTYQITAQLVSRLITEYKLGFERVVGHNAFSGKDCPQTLLANNGELWELFMECVKAEYNVVNYMSDYEISAVSNNKDIMNDNGRIIKVPNYTQSVSYTVTVKNKTTGASKTMTFSSIVHGVYTE